MGYHIDLEKITIDEYLLKISSAYLPPSRMILKEETVERFGYFKSIGITNLKELQQQLSKKAKLEELSHVSCFSGDYLTILLRELNSMIPKPHKIADFTDVSSATAEKLSQVGINNTQKLYDNTLTRSDRQKLADSAGIGYGEILELTKLADLSRIKWVGVTFAQILFLVGADTVEKVSNSEPAQLHLQINQLIKEKNLYKGQIGLNDVRIIIDSACELPNDIKY